MKSANHTSLRVYEDIKNMMLDYEIVPGQKLIFEDLARRLGVSRTPVNNALSLLAKEGFLDFFPNQGYTVHELTKKEGEELWQVREIVELGAVPIAIRKLTPEKVEALESRKRDYEDYVNKVPSQVVRIKWNIDLAFHTCIVRMTDNNYLADYFSDIGQRNFLRHKIEGFGADRAREVIKEHEEIFEAIKLKDVESAKEAIKSHIKAGKKYIFSQVFRK
ncbi:MAG: GntR family transcriptional regulator [Deltaproteobacteria bacterium]|nr:GntR family transcriptional regulator [Deltaproteobacteria bacterium]